MQTLSEKTALAPPPARATRSPKTGRAGVFHPLTLSPPHPLTPPPRRLPLPHPLHVQRQLLDLALQVSHCIVALRARRASGELSRMAASTPRSNSA